MPPIPDNLPLKPTKVDPEKITRYLLSDTHSGGRTKAAFFKRKGFKEEKWQELSDALIAHALQSRISKSKQSDYGTKYIVDGWLQCPDGSRSMIRAIWFEDLGSQTIRFVTAYPLKKARLP